MVPRGEQDDMPFFLLYTSLFLLAYQPFTICKLCAVVVPRIAIKLYALVFRYQG